MKKWTIAFLTVAIFSLSNWASAQSYKVKSDNGVNLRSEPNTNSKVLTSIPPGAEVKVVDRSNSEWYKVTYNGQTGYVSSKYVAEDKGGTKKNDDDQKSEKKKASSDNSRSTNDGAGITYTTAVGVRAGWEGGITFKHFIKNNAALEGILSRGWGYGGFRITGLYEIHKNAFDVPRLNWFYGLGAHVGSYGERYWKGDRDDDCDRDGYYYDDGKRYSCGRSRMVIGIDAILGIEYHLKEIPFTVGFDIKPFFDLYGRGDHFGDGALSIRYVIK